MEAKLDRREFLRLAGLAPLGASLSLLIDPSGASSWIPNVDFPNILVILTDDQPFYATEDIPGFGIGMPKLDSILREQGIQFNRTYCNTPKCAPNRANFQTGLYPDKHRIFSNSHASRRFRKVEYEGGSDAAFSLGAKLHREAGYNCGFFGRWQVDYNETPTYVAPGYKSEWGRFVATVDPTGLPVKVNMDGKIRKPGFTRNEETSWLTERVVAWIEGNPQADIGPVPEPWFAILAFNSPHGPYRPSTANAGTFSNVSMPIRPNFNHYDPNKPKYVTEDPQLTNSQIAEMQTEWRGKMEEIQDIDDAVERLSQVIDFDETYMFFSSDNGYLFGEHRQIAKASPYEESSRTPLFVRGPSVRPGVTSNVLASTIDITATIYEIVGLETYDIDGRSLLPPMFSEDPFEWRDGLYLHQPYDEQGISNVPGWHAIRTDEYIYIEYMTGTVELYDMSADPYQLANIAPTADPVLLYELSTRLLQMKTSSGEDLRAAEVTTV